jgi:leucyl/phenylalanyl-tRNA--protein transferase
MILVPDELRVTRSLAKTLRNAPYEVRFDSAFDEVMRGCAAPRADQPGTWITAEMRAAYGRLHELGYAHCAETWIEGELAGGLYGVAIGRMFYGESMFTRRPDASKCALAALVWQLRACGFTMIDCQQATMHLASLGAREIPRDEFLAGIARLTAQPGPDWSAMPMEFPDV